MKIRSKNLFLIEIFKCAKCLEYESVAVRMYLYTEKKEKN